MAAAAARRAAPGEAHLCIELRPAQANSMTRQPSAAVPADWGCATGTYMLQRQPPLQCACCLSLSASCGAPSTTQRLAMHLSLIGVSCISKSPAAMSLPLVARCCAPMRRHSLHQAHSRLYSMCTGTPGG